MIPPTVVLDARTVSDRFPGIGRFVLGLARGLSRLGSPTLVTGPEPDPRLPIPPLRGCPCQSGPFTWQQQWQVPRLLRRLGASLYHSPYYMMPFRPGVPAVVTCYDTIPASRHGSLGPAGRLTWRVAHRLAFRASAAVCVPSEAAREAVSLLFPDTAGKLVVIRPGSDPVGRQDPGEARLAGSRLGVPPRFLLSVGSNKPHKDLGLLVRAWALALEEAPGLTSGVTLVMAGPRDRRHPEPAASTARLGLERRVLDLGMVDDTLLSALYSCAALFVCPSRVEGFGLPLLEAMAHGCPCLTSSDPALIETAGGAALVFQSGDAMALASSILDLLSDSAAAEHLASAGRARSAAFDWRAAAEATVSVYLRVGGFSATEPLDCVTP